MSWNRFAMPAHRVNLLDTYKFDQNYPLRWNRDAIPSEWVLI